MPDGILGGGPLGRRVGVQRVTANSAAAVSAGRLIMQSWLPSTSARTVTYQVNDGTGSLVVVSKEGGAPREGAKVGVEGTFRAVFTLQTESVAALEESRRTAL